MFPILFSSNLPHTQKKKTQAPNKPKPAANRKNLKPKNQISPSSLYYKKKKQTHK